MTDDLRGQLAEVEERQTLTIFMTFKSHGWARFNIDGKLGALTIQSDWGDWQHVWGGGPGSWGHPTFTDFLKDRAGCHYLADKLYYGRDDRAVIDGDETRKRLFEKILRARRAEDIGKRTARDLWDAVEDVVDEIEDRPWGDHVWVVWRDACEEFGSIAFSEFFHDVHELICSRPHPRMTFLTEQLLPLMVSYLRGEIDGSGRPVAQSVADGHTSPEHP